MSQVNCNSRTLYKKNKNKTSTILPNSNQDFFKLLVKGELNIFQLFMSIKTLL